MDLDPTAMELFRQGYDKILAGLAHLGYDVHDENFAETAGRAAKGFHELVLGENCRKQEIAKLLSKTFPAKYGEMVISKHDTTSARHIGSVGRRATIEPKPSARRSSALSASRSISTSKIFCMHPM